jgi:hypothetical protein
MAVVKGKGAVDKQKRRERTLYGIASKIGQERRTIVLDLESTTKGFSDGIRMCDSIVLQSEHSRFEIVFLGVNKRRGLECYLPDDKNGICDYEGNGDKDRKSIFLKIGQSRKVWECTLKNLRGLTIYLERVQSTSDDPSIIAGIKLHLMKSKKDLSIA